MATMVEQFRVARKVATPILGITTVDPQATITAAVTQGMKEEHPAVQWDCVRGFSPCNKAGKAALAGMCQQPSAVKNPTEALAVVAPLAPEDCVLFFHNAAPYLRQDAQGSAAFIQAVWNLRDEFKSPRRTLALLAPAITLPPALEQDVVMIDDPLPTDEERGEIVDRTAEDAEVTLTPEERERAIKNLRGLGAFATEQVVAMALAGNRLDMEVLFERARKTIEKNSGLTVWRGKEDFSQIGGMEWLKSLMRRKKDGKRCPTLVVFVDELEKVMGGDSSQESSGVSSDQKRTLLTEMEDNGYSGCILVGPPGVSKTVFAKSAGKEFGCLTVALDLGALKDKWVGSSEQMFRAAFKIIKDLAGEGGAYFIATSNGIEKVVPELKRRFKDDIFFIDLPTAEARKDIWRIHMTRCNLSEQPLPGDDGWTGAEIAKCCERADEWECSLVEAAESIVPLSVSDGETVDRLRQSAEGRWQSADRKGVYCRAVPGAEKRRAFRADE